MQLRPTNEQQMELRNQMTYLEQEVRDLGCYLNKTPNSDGGRIINMETNKEVFEYRNLLELELWINAQK